MTKDLIIRSSSAEFLIFESQTHDKGIQVRFEEGDLWLTQKAIGELFNTTRNNITMHINDIYDSYELEKNSTSKKFLLVQNEGNRANSEKEHMGPTSWKNSPTGKISHEIACDKALTEFEKYRIKQDKLYKSDFDLLVEETNK